MVNRFREQLVEGRTTFGLWVTLESPSVTEIATDIGLEWVCVDMEHGHLGYKELIEHARAARGGNTSVLARVPAIRPDTIKRVLDIGVDGVVLPLPRSA